MTEPDKTPADWVTQVIQANGRDLLGYFIRRVSSPDAAADLLGNLFVVIWRRRDKLPSDPEQARKWCFGIARNALREHRRGHARQIALADTLRAHLETTALRYAADPAHAAEQREQSAKLHAAIRRLDSRSQELITLIDWDRFSISDAAEHLGMNPSSARTCYSKVRAKLAYLLDDDAPRTASRELASDEDTAPRQPMTLKRHPNAATEGTRD